MRGNITSVTEVRDIFIADLVLIVAFSLTITGGIAAFSGGGAAKAVGTFEYYLPIAALAVSLSFILHELMHKFIAQRYGASAEFRTSFSGLAITLVTGAFGFLLGIPGATMIYTNRFTNREDGIVSIAGPLTNLAVFLVFLVLLLAASPAPGSYLFNAINFTIFISLLLAFFNMLPIFPLDGSKVLRWDRRVYAAFMLVLLGLIIIFNVLTILEVLIMIGIALVFSFIYRFTL